MSMSSGGPISARSQTQLRESRIEEFIRDFRAQANPDDEMLRIMLHTFALEIEIYQLRYEMSRLGKA